MMRWNLSMREKALLILLLCVAILGGIYAKGARQEKKALETVLKEEKHFDHAFGDVSLIAKAAYVYDIKTGTALFSRNANKQLPLASLTKVMTALTALNELPPNAVITIDPQALAEEGDSGLYNGEQWHLDDLLRFTLVSSSNDGAQAIARSASKILTSNALDNSFFLKKMNDTALALGLTSTFFTNPTGLDSVDLSSTGGMSTAQEMTRITIELMKKNSAVFSATVARTLTVKSLSGFVHVAKNTNTYTDSTQLLLASKTGFTDLAGGNLSIIFSAGPEHPVAITVLGSTEAGRFSDTAALLAATMRYITAQ